MKVTFYSNFLTEHSLTFCLEMQKRLGNDFKFVSMVKIPDWRIKLGWEDLNKKYDFVVRSYENEEAYNEAKKLAIESDVVITWSMTTNVFVDERLKKDKLLFRGTYRIFLFLNGFWKFFSIKNMKSFYDLYIKYRKNKNLYLLCSNAYGSKEFNKFGLYKGKTYKWGFFPPNNIYDIDKLIEDKEKNEKINIIWVARFIKWKHPEVVVKLAKNLKKQNYNFKIQMLGTGELEEEIKEKIKKQDLEDVIEMVGSVQSSKVKDYMEKANILIATSDSAEGWGAVINEAMNTGCAIVANKKMGSVPTLIGDNSRGFMYDNYKDLENKVKKLIRDKELRQKLGKNAYQYILTEWTAELAAERIIKLSSAIINNENIEIKTGPVSKGL